MKRIISFIIGMLMICAVFSACGTETPEETKDSSAQTSGPESSGIPQEEMGGIEIYIRNGEYNMDFYGIGSQFTDLVDREKLEEWKTSIGFYSKTWDLNDLSILALIKQFNISKEDFIAANYSYEKYSPYTDEQIEALYSDDKQLLAEEFANPRAVNVNGDLYSPRWIADHSLEELQAAGITKGMLQEKYGLWVDTWGEDFEICTKMKTKLDAYPDDTGSPQVETAENTAETSADTFAETLGSAETGMSTAGETSTD